MLVITGSWHVNEITPDKVQLIHSHFGVASSFALFTSGAKVEPAMLGPDAIVAGMDWIRHEVNPKPNEVDYPINVYHYVVIHGSDDRYRVYDCGHKGALAPGWSTLEDLEVYIKLSSLAEAVSCDATSEKKNQPSVESTLCQSQVPDISGETIRRVFFDESGNSGQNLLDPDSPVFTLASCQCDTQQAIELNSEFAETKAKELKFSKMVGRPRNEQMVLHFLQSPFINSTTVKIVVVHKRFMVVTKLVDLVIEPAARKRSIDLYKGAGNLAISNLLYLVAPKLLGEDTWNSFLGEFANVVWRRDITSWSKFLSVSKFICTRLELTHPDYAGFFLPVLGLRGHFKEFMEDLTGDELDPIPTSYANLANAWGKQLGQVFDVIADESKVLAAHKALLMRLSDPGLKPVEIGYNSRTIAFPLRVNRIIPVVSDGSREIQFADLLAGAACCALKSQIRDTSSTFAEGLKNLISGKCLISNLIWPEKKVNPSELNADGDDTGRVNINEYTARILSGDASTRR